MNREQTDIKEIVSDRSLFDCLRGARFFITGATGLIGSILVKTLIEANKTYDLDIVIIAQVRSKDKAKKVFGECYKFIEFTDSYNVECDYMVHTVSPTGSKYFIEHPVETIKTSVGSTLDVLDNALNCNATVVYLSSMEQYGVPLEDGQLISEDYIGIIDHLNVRSSYSESKRICECLCASYAKEYNMDVKVARLAQTFGSGISRIDNRMPSQFAKSVMYGNNIILHTEGLSLSNFVYITDAISGILVILLKGKRGEAYNICNDIETRSVRETAQLVCDVVAGGKISVNIERKDDMGYAPTSRYYLVSSKLKELGWIPKVNLIDGYKRLIDYCMENDF